MIILLIAISCIFLYYFTLIVLILIRMRSRYNDYYDHVVLEKTDKEYIY